MAAEQTICWNGFRLDVSGSWDTIVKDRCHLIFEQSAKPLFELRWQRLIREKDESNLSDRIIKRLQTELGITLQICDALPKAMRFPPKYNVKTLGRQSDTPEAALISCRSCNTLTFIKFYPELIEHGYEQLHFLTSLDCHPRNNVGSAWAIHDITFTLPKDYNLESFSFGFGLSWLRFTKHSANLHMFKLAPAVEYLKHHSLEELAAHYCRLPAIQWQKIDRQTLLYFSEPSFIQRNIARLRRKKTFIGAKFCYYAEHDRILGSFLENSHSLNRQELQLIQNSYAIVQKEKTPAPDP